MKIVCYDFETFYNSHEYTLSKMGPVEYIRDGRFDPFMVGVAVDSHPCVVISGTATVRHVLQAKFTDEHIYVAHNGGGFDHLILSEHFGIRPRHMWDTIWAMRWCGLNSICAESHAALTAMLGNGEKRPGTVLSNDKHWPYDFTPDEQAYFTQYCNEDTTQMRDNLRVMLPYLTEDCMTFMSLTARMATEPMLYANAELLQAYLNKLDTEAEHARQELMAIFHFNNLPEFFKALRSADKFAAMLRELGVEPPVKVSEKKTATAIQQAEAVGDIERANALRQEPILTYAFAKDDVDFLDLREHEDPRVRLLVETRLEFNSSIMRSRTETFLKFARQGKPIPFMLSAFKAHTGRYSAGKSDSEKSQTDRLQWQNLSKRNPAYKPLRKAIQVPHGHVIVAVDSSQIEARCLAWEAGQTDLVEQFRSGADPYAELAAKLTPEYTAQQIHDGNEAGDATCTYWRNLGKTFVLSCLAGDTEVLTDTGWKRIDTVSVNDKLWDGETWVHHQGLICNGWRNTVNLDGITLTPDHLIWNGTTWNTAGELLHAPKYLNSALRCAGASLRTCVSSLGDKLARRLMRSIKSGVASAEPCIGLVNIPLCDVLLRAVRHVLSATVRTLNLPHKNIWTQSQGLNSGSLLLSVPTAGVTGKIQSASSVWWKSTVHAVKQAMWFCLPISCQVKLPAATNVQNVKALLQDKNSTIITQTYAPMLHTGGDYLTVSPIALAGVPIPSTQTGITMVGEALQFRSLIGESFLRIYSRCRDGMTRLWNWIGLITAKAMRRGIFGFVLGHSMPETDGVINNSKPTQLNSPSVSKNLRLVYDIMNSGPNNRFLVKTNSGALLVHNCGYGSGAAKVSQSLLKSGVKLSPDRAEHNRLAGEYLRIYRRSNYAITRFWDTCRYVIEALARGESGQFGGPRGDTFKFGMMPVVGRWLVPSIALPSGFILRYPNLRTRTGDTGKVEYVYDIRRGKNVVPTRLYSGVLANNCIAEGTLVYTDSGWKPIENITLTDKVYDGVDFVAHQGLVCQGIQACVSLDGVHMTPEHKVLTYEGWCKSESTQLERLHRCALRTAGCRGDVRSQFQRCYRGAFRYANRSAASCGFWGESRQEFALEMGIPLRLRRVCRTFYWQRKRLSSCWMHPCVSGLYGKQCKTQAFQTRLYWRQAVSCLAAYARALSKSQVSCLCRLWGARNFYLRTLARFSEFCCGYGGDLQRGFGFRPYRYQWKLLSRELSVDILSCQQSQSERCVCRYRCDRVFTGYRNQFNNDSLPYSTRLAARTFSTSPVTDEHPIESLPRKCEISSRVYDILNCGPRHRFVVKGQRGPIIVSNCTQSFAFQIMLWEACRMYNDGVKLHGNIHDCWFSVVPTAQAQAVKDKMLFWMSQVPPWAEGLPIAAEAKIGTDFSIC